MKKKIYANLNNYISCNTVVEENIDEKNKKVTAVMKANIDTTRLDIEITKNSKVFAAESSDKLSIVVFFTREQNLPKEALMIKFLKEKKLKLKKRKNKMELLLKPQRPQVVAL